MAVGIDLDNLAKESLSSFSTTKLLLSLPLFHTVFFGRKSLYTVHIFRV